MNSKMHFMKLCIYRTKNSFYQILFLYQTQLRYTLKIRYRLRYSWSNLKSLEEIKEYNWNRRNFLFTLSSLKSREIAMTFNFIVSIVEKIYHPRSRLWSLVSCFEIVYIKLKRANELKDIMVYYRNSVELCDFHQFPKTHQKQFYKTSEIIGFVWN